MAIWQKTDLHFLITFYINKINSPLEHDNNQEKLITATIGKSVSFSYAYHSKISLKNYATLGKWYLWVSISSFVKWDY